MRWLRTYPTALEMSSGTRDRARNQPMSLRPSFDARPKFVRSVPGSGCPATIGSLHCTRIPPRERAIGRSRKPAQSQGGRGPSGTAPSCGGGKSPAQE